MWMAGRHDAVATDLGESFQAGLSPHLTTSGGWPIRFHVVGAGKRAWTRYGCRVQKETLGYRGRKRADEVIVGVSSQDLVGNLYLAEDRAEATLLLDKATRLCRERGGRGPSLGKIRWPTEILARHAPAPQRSHWPEPEREGAEAPRPWPPHLRGLPLRMLLHAAPSPGRVGPPAAHSNPLSPSDSLGR